jgi:hypothetical protein
VLIIVAAGAGLTALVAVDLNLQRQPTLGVQVGYTPNVRRATVTTAACRN